MVHTVFNEPRLSLPILAGSNAAIALAYLFELNPINARTAWHTDCGPTAWHTAMHTGCGRRLLLWSASPPREPGPAAAAGKGRGQAWHAHRHKWSDLFHLARPSSPPRLPPPLLRPPRLEQAASWALLACVMKGFAVSVVSPPTAPPPHLTAQQLSTYFVPILNAALGLRAKIFNCTDPRLALCAPQVESVPHGRDVTRAWLRSAPALARLQHPRPAARRPILSPAPTVLPTGLCHHAAYS